MTNSTEKPFARSADYEKIARRAKMRLLQMHFDSGVGHIGGNLSCLDILLTLFHFVLSPEDRFVLSKGHAAGALYTSLWSIGVLDEKELSLFHKDNTRLSGHPAPNTIPQIPFATGSLGHGLSLANGLALAKSLRYEPGRVYCLLSDGEWQEGSNWEALIFGAHRNLPLTAIIDANGLQGFGSTLEIASSDHDNLKEQISAHGVPVKLVEGHEPESLLNAFQESANDGGMQIIIAKTAKGSGVSFMEHRMEWHYLPLTANQLEIALSELSEARA